MKYFAYDPDIGIYFFDTADKAAQWAADAIDSYRDGSWDDNVEDIIWGEVKQKSSMHVVDGPDDGADKIYVNYNLEDVE